MKHSPLCECCTALAELRAKKQARDRRSLDNAPEKARARWKRYNAKRVIPTSGPLEPPTEA